jgi:hypothetical protein
MSTRLFEQMLAFNYEDAGRSELMRLVWSVTPFMIDVQTGPIMGDAYMAMKIWCRHNLGPQAFMLGDPATDGNWQFGGATICGSTWLGFKTNAQMESFIAAFPDHVESEAVE